MFVDRYGFVCLFCLLDILILFKGGDIYNGRLVDLSGFINVICVFVNSKSFFWCFSWFVGVLIIDDIIFCEWIFCLFINI